MKICKICGREIPDDKELCPDCEIKQQNTTQTQKLNYKSRGIVVVIKVFAVLGCIASVGVFARNNPTNTALLGFLTLLWTVPMTVYLFRRFKNNEAISVLFKICVLLFLNPIAGICLLCLKTE